MLLRFSSNVPDGLLNGRIGKQSCQVIESTSHRIHLSRVAFSKPVNYR